MSKYKAGDKVVVEIEKAALTDNGGGFYTVLDYMQSAISVDEKSEPLSTYTEPLEDTIQKHTVKIARLVMEKEALKDENERLKAENEKMSVKIDAYELYGDQHEEEYNQAFNQGAEAAWELARKIILPPSKGGMSSDDYVAIFGNCISEAYVMKNYTYSEASAKVSEWEEGKDEIKVGDIVKHNETEYTGIVTRVSERMDKITIIFKDGSSESYDSSMFHKTGRHIDIDRFLNQIGGE